MSNKDFIGAFATRVTRDLDIGEFSPDHKGEVLQVWVNAPGIIESQLGGRAFTVTNSTDESGLIQENLRYDEEPAEKEYSRKRRVISILYDIAPEMAGKLDDTLTDWLWMRGAQMYREYHEGLRKNSNGG